MNVTNPPIQSKEDKLVHNALTHLRAVFAGNGVKKDDIRIISHKVIRHVLVAGTYIELKPVMNEKNSPGKTVSGQLVGSKEEAMKAINQLMAGAASNPTMKARIANVLLERPDKGFGLSKQILPIDFIKNEFTWHQPCPACNGTTKSTCVKCGGRKLETCFKCTGRGIMKCPMCRATGLLQGNKCPKCRGQRYVPCDGCQRSGFMGCRTCNAQGVTNCAACNGIGFKSHVIALTAQALTYFEYDGKSIPKNAADAIEMGAPYLAAKNIIDVTGRIADDKENALGANYEIGFPCGEILFQIGKQEIKAQLFGNNSKLTGMPNILDKIILPTVGELENAANDIGSVAAAIKNATRYKLIAKAYLLLQKTNPKNASGYLIKNYDVCISPAMIERVVSLAQKTTGLITKKPRFIGLAIGLVITAILTAFYCALPWRTVINNLSLGLYFKLLLEFILDLIPAIIGGIITKHCIRKTGAKSIKTALGHLVPPDQKNKLIARTQGLGIWGYIGAVIISFSMLEIMFLAKLTTPAWLVFLKHVIGL